MLGIVAVMSYSSNMILVADDNDILRVTLTRQLAELGYVSHSVDNGADAVECAISGAYKLLILDVDLPVLNGIQVTKIIRDQIEQQKTAHMPIVALTGVYARQDCETAGMDDYLRKPVTLSELRSVTEKWAPQKESTIIARITPALAAIISAKRKMLGYSYETLGARADIQVEALQAIEAGERVMTIVDLVKLGLALEIPTSDLVDAAQRLADISGDSQ